MGLLGLKVKSTIWLQRCGHPSNDVLSVMLKQSDIVSSCDDKQHLCSFCIAGTMSRLTFVDKKESSIFPFQKVHSDLWGPSPIKFIEGYKY